MDKVYNSLEFKKVSHTFKQGDSLIKVLHKINFTIPKGAIIGLLGASGSGKSTLLQIAGLLEKPTTGEIVIKGKGTSNIGEGERTRLRKSNIGFVFQKSHLLPEFNAMENIVIAQKIYGKSNGIVKEDAIRLLEEINLAKRALHRPAKLSGGEQQRVAIARALVNNPSIVLADEPTGNLDFESSKNVADILIRTVRSSGASALIATHSQELASRMDKIYKLIDGKIEFER
ncbi:MAG: ABC transporter [Pelagibacterales bacterium]|nr:ABC transporter [Pelagibacterales bacterium]